MATVGPQDENSWPSALPVALVSSILVIFAIDVVDPDVVLFSYLNVPVVASAALGRPRLTATLSGLAVALGLVDATTGGYFTDVTGWIRLLLMVLMLTASIALAAYIQRISAGRAAAMQLLDGAMRSGLDPQVFWRPVRSPSRVITDFTFVDVNDVACEFFRKSRDDLLGRSVVELFPDFAASPQFAMYTKLANDGEPVIVQAEEVHSVVTGTRNVYDIRAIRVDSILSISWRDVSANIETRKLLEQSEEHYRLLAEHATDVVWRTSPAGSITWVSPAVTKVLGWDPSEVIGHMTTDFLHPDDITRSQAAKANAPADEPLHQRVRLRTKDGVYRVIEVVGSTLVDRDGKVTGRSGGWRDVTTEAAAYERLASTEARFRVLATTTTDVIYQTDRDYRITWVSPSVTAALGWHVDDIVGQFAYALVHPDDLRPLAPDGIESASGAASSDYTIRIAQSDGGYRWMSVSTALVADGSGSRVTRMHDVEEEVRHARFLQHRADTDALTGLASRRDALDRLEVMAQERRVGSHLGLLLLDIDLFKNINDTFGHAAGDSVLRTIATRVAGQVRETDVTARLGGDELLVILNGVESADAAAMIAQHIRGACSQPIDLADGRTVSTTVSVGVALSLDGESPSAVLARADAAMYEAKRAGRDGIATSHAGD